MLVRRALLNGAESEKRMVGSVVTMRDWQVVHVNSIVEVTKFARWDNNVVQWVGITDCLQLGITFDSKNLFEIAIDLVGFLSLFHLLLLEHLAVVGWVESVGSLRSLCCDEGLEFDLLLRFLLSEVLYCVLVETRISSLELH